MLPLSTSPPQLLCLLPPPLVHPVDAVTAAAPAAAPAAITAANTYKWLPMLLLSGLSYFYSYCYLHELLLPLSQSKVLLYTHYRISAATVPKIQPLPHNLLTSFAASDITAA